MSGDVPSIIPPDDSGRDTFERYCYQAHIAFPYCLSCALGGNPISIVLEHLEDVALEFPDGWRFLQIKTRDLERGPWKLGDLLCKGGALRSALRTCTVLGSLPASLEIHVEGVIDRKDPIQCLLNPEDHVVNPALAEKVQETLHISEEDCKALIGRVRLVHSHPTRDTIHAQNLRLLSGQARHLPAETLEDIYDRILALIFGAMQARALPTNWKSTFLSTGTLHGAVRTRFSQKRLTRENFAPIVGPINIPPQPLLRRSIEVREQPLTQLEQKLILGAASAEIIGHAKRLRAAASEREYEVLSTQMFDDEIIDDLQERLLIRAHGLVNQYGTGKTPAAAIWNQLIAVLSQQRDVIDRSGVFARDSDLLLGKVCDLSDHCLTEWGVADA